MSDRDVKPEEVLPSVVAMKVALVSGIAKAAEARGAHVADLLDDQAKHLDGLALLTSQALLGDDRARAHLKAQLAGAAFVAHAEAYLEARAWRLAILDVLSGLAKDAVPALARAAMKAAAEGLRDELSGALSR